MKATGLALVAGLVAGTAAAAPVDYLFTPTHSFVHFEWPRTGLSTLRGRFDKLSGRLQLDRDAGRAQGRAELRLDSVNTGRPALDEALRGTLGTAGAPVLTLEITAPALDQGRPMQARARFDWRGRPQELELRAERFHCYTHPLLRREVCGGDFHGSLDAAALGLVPDAAFGLAPTLRLQVQVEAIRQEAE